MNFGRGATNSVRNISPNEHLPKTFMAHTEIDTCSSESPSTRNYYLSNIPQPIAKLRRIKRRSMRTHSVPQLRLDRTRRAMPMPHHIPLRIQQHYLRFLRVRHIKVFLP